VCGLVDSAVTSVAFDVSGSYLAVGDGGGDVQVKAVKDWSQSAVGRCHSHLGAMNISLLFPYISYILYNFIM